MALHISEIGVRLAVGTPAAPDGASRAAAPAPHPAFGTRGQAGAIPPERMEELVENCVRRVLDRLRALEER